MKKLVFSLLTAILAVCNSHAQTSLVATLNHDGNITDYYGIDALGQAHTAAVNGDIITLSSGSFSSCNITKAVTIRGAGMQYSDGMEPTILQNDFYVYIDSESNHALTMEGIFHDNMMYLTKALKPQFFKCRFGAVNTYSTNATYKSSDGSVKDANFIHCKIARFFLLYGGDNASFDNCFVRDAVISGTSNATYQFTNCVISLCYGDNNYIGINNIHPECSNIKNSYLKNCIIFADVKTSFPATTTLYHNVSNVDCFTNAKNSTNKVESEFTKLFKTWTGLLYSDEEKFDLTESAAATYLGDDGKQVGMYGGSLPYDPVPTHPRITKLNVASKTTVDGKLSVDIEVKGADY